MTYFSSILYPGFNSLEIRHWNGVVTDEYNAKELEETEIMKNEQTWSGLHVLIFLSSLSSS
jgi:hypothetical protein